MLSNKLTTTNFNTTFNISYIFHRKYQSKFIIQYEVLLTLSNSSHLIHLLYSRTLTRASWSWISRGPVLV